MEPADYYQILGLEKTASSQQIKDAYRHMAFKYHPDRNMENREAAEKMKGVNEAYAVLSNPEKRSEYDRLRQRFGYSAYHRFRKNYSDEEIFKGSDLNQAFEEMAKSFGLRGFEEIFKEFYGSQYRTFKFHKSGLSGRGFVFFGGFGRPRSIKTPIPLLGNLGRAAQLLFNKLAGGQLPQKGADITGVITLHPSLAREGGPYAYYFRKKSKKLIVKIPPGIKNGQQIRLSGLGEEGKAGGPPGDLFLKAVVKKSLIQRLKERLK